MSVEAKIRFHKNKKFLGSYFVYNGDCDGRDTFCFFDLTVLIIL